jgi:hypothetical protein
LINSLPEFSRFLIADSEKVIRYMGVDRIDVSIDDLKTAIESQHGGVATLAQSVPVRETFEGQPIWEGVVHVFDLEGHPTATRAYAMVLAN